MTAILAIETCTAAGSVAVLRSADCPNETILANNEWMRSRSHAEIATPAIADAVKISGGWPIVDIVAVGVGPGSFTGIRVGLNAARTIGWSLNRPVITIRTTDALIEAARGSGLSPRGNVIVAVLNAQMGLQFAAWEVVSSSASGGRTEPAAFDVPTLATKLKLLRKPITLVGESADAIIGELRDLGLVVNRPSASYLDFPSALSVARLAARKISISLDASALVRMYQWRTAQPLYIRGSGAEEKK